MYNILAKFSKPCDTNVLSWLEHMTVNHGVPGSSPGWGAKPCRNARLFCWENIPFGTYPRSGRIPLGCIRSADQST